MNFSSMAMNATTPAASSRRGAWMALSSLAAALVLAGCVSSAGIESSASLIDGQSVGIPSAGGASAAAQTAAQNPITDQWWHAYGDQQLDELVARTLASNPNLKLAQARLTKASAAVEGQDADSGPKAQFSADATRERFSANSIYPAPLGGSIRTLANAQFGGSWELDFFGQHEAALTAALGNQRAAQADVAAARQLMATRVVQAYVQLAMLQEQRGVVARAIEQRGEVLGLIQQRVKAGLDSKVELSMGEGAMPEARLQLAMVDEKIDATRIALAALVGAPVSELADLKPSLSTLRPVALPHQVPADLLARRADIAAARWRIEAATGAVDEAKARFYPNVSLTAFIGLSSIGLSKLVESGSEQYGVGPAIHLPIFDAGRLRANLRARNADLDLAVESYNAAVIDAVRESAEQLSSLKAIAAQQREQDQALKSAEATYDIARQRYEAGLTGHIQLINAESNVLAQRRQTLELKARELVAQANLARALGGGYQPVAVVAQHAGPTSIASSTSQKAQ